VIAHARALGRIDGRSPRGRRSDDREVLSLVQPEVAKHSVWSRRPGRRSSPVLGDASLQQLVLNLIMNGIDAMAEVTVAPGRLLISCERVEERTTPVSSSRAGRGYRGCGG